MAPGAVLDLGRADYTPTWALQQRLVEERRAGRGVDTLVLVEHPEVITLGRRASGRQNVLTDEIPVVEVERGGDVTYHGPGQLVGYPILQLDGAERDVHAFLRAMEEGLIGACRALGVAAVREAGLTGVWVETAGGLRKLASIGVAVRGWVTLHGFALNVSTDLARFGAIRPCGMEASVMTSLTALLGRTVTLGEVKPHVIEHLGRTLRRAF